MICTSCCELGEFTSSSYAYALWNQHPCPAQSYLQKVSHSHGAGGPCPPFTWIKHKYPDAAPIVCNEVALKTLSLLRWLQNSGQYFSCWCAASPPCMCSKLSHCLPQLLTLPRDLPSPTMSWGIEHLEERDCVSVPPVRRGPWQELTAGRLGLVLGCVRSCITTALTHWLVIDRCLHYQAGGRGVGWF